MTNLKPVYTEGVLKGWKTGEEICNEDLVWTTGDLNSTEVTWGESQQNKTWSEQAKRQEVNLEKYMNHDTYDCLVWYVIVKYLVYKILL